MSTAVVMRLVMGGEWPRTTIYSFAIQPTQSRSFPILDENVYFWTTAF